MAELHMAHGDYAAARTEIAKLIEEDPTQRSLTIMAAITRATGGADKDVQEQLTKALSAARDPEWICENCGHAHAHWEAICGACSGFDTVNWKRPHGTLGADVSNLLPQQIATAPRPDDDAILLPYSGDGPAS